MKDSVAGAIVIIVYAVLVGFAIEASIDRELDQVRGMRVAVQARAAVSKDERPDGPLTIVRGTESEKYYFLNKKSYLVHTASTSREGTVLTAENSFDKGRADRHAQVTTKKRAIRTKLEDGRWRATVPDSDRSAELILDPPPVPKPSAYRITGVAALIGIVLMLGLTWKVRAGIAAPVATMVSVVVLTYLIDAHIGAASSLATGYLSKAGAATFVAISPIACRAWAIGLGVLAIAAAALAASERGALALAAAKRDRHAWYAMSPALLGMGVLVGIPFVFGVGLSLFRHRHGSYTFIGLDNFIGILTSPGRGFLEPRSLSYSLAITVLWTALNVLLHVGIGLLLAMLLQNRAPRWSKLYRMILIVPWAVPAYLTALIWRSMFDPDVGVINQVLGLQGMSWMHDVKTAFLANLVTNVWLGFPFMMVVALGALTSIPKSLYEAAEVDGASWWQQFVRITLPLLRPAMLPAVILGSIWTFNKFEVIYLVSEGKPDGATDILVTEAYRWAFERGLAQGGAYGYAAAYSVLIFVVLLVYGWMTSRVSRAAEEALR